MSWVELGGAGWRWLHGLVIHEIWHIRYFKYVSLDLDVKNDFY